MRLGTTVRPIEGPHDLDFVCELSLGHEFVEPMRLLHALYGFLRANGTYRPMTSLMNRCVRVEYANEFYMDVLPACRNGFGNGTCIKVPDREVKGWKDSDPVGYATWFERKTRILFLERLLEKAEPIPRSRPSPRRSHCNWRYSLSSVAVTCILPIPTWRLLQLYSQRLLLTSTEVSRRSPKPLALSWRELQRALNPHEEAVAP